MYSIPPRPKNRIRTLNGSAADQLPQMQRLQKYSHLMQKQSFLQAFNSMVCLVGQEHNAKNGLTGMKKLTRQTTQTGYKYDSGWVYQFVCREVHPYNGISVWMKQDNNSVSKSVQGISNEQDTHYKQAGNPSPVTQLFKCRGRGGNSRPTPPTAANLYVVNDFQQRPISWKGFHHSEGRRQQGEGFRLSVTCALGILGLQEVEQTSPAWGK